MIKRTRSVHKAHSVNEGFTLLEVLIAMAVLAISMLSVYSLLNASIDMVSYGKSKLTVIDKGYERVLIHTYYPRISRQDNITENGTTTLYKYTSEAVPSLPNVSRVKLRVSNDSSVVTYEYFERTR